MHATFKHGTLSLTSLPTDGVVYCLAIHLESHSAKLLTSYDQA